jgi:site-specific DNA-methyltransferase (adenine-specific)
MASRRRTTTSNFGVGSRESHDSTPFYDRFRAPELSDDATVLTPVPVPEPFICGDARHMDDVADGSVALVVTSPPYFAGKQYEEELEREGIPASYLEYLGMLTDVFAECVRKLEPGGRIAVNVANLGRKPYRSLSSDVIRILEHDLGLLMRGEVIWQKGDGASGSCAWGSFRSPMNPVLRDITERVIIASKGRFDRARSAAQRAKDGLPSRITLPTDDFMALTLDVWSIQPESARRVGHPAPFPVELPEQLIRLYTFEDDLVLDPFMGSGSSLVAAARLGRRYVGYDLDPTYVELSRGRVAEALTDSGVAGSARREPSVDDGRSAAQLAEAALTDAGFTITGTAKRIPRSGTTVSFTATDRSGAAWIVDVAGPNTRSRGGLTRIDLVWRTLGRLAAVRSGAPTTPILVLTTELPRPGSDAAQALAAALPELGVEVLLLLDPADQARLGDLGGGRPGNAS